MEPIITSVTLGILANSLYDLMKGEGPLTGMAKYIDEHVLNRSKLFNRQTVAKILQDSRNAQLLEKLENYQQTKEEQMLISAGKEFSKILQLPENHLLQECVPKIIKQIEQADIIRRTEELSNIALKLRDSIGCYKRSVEDKVAEIIELLRSGENIVLVLGEAGSGKSALLKHLYKALKDTDFTPSEVDLAKVVYLDVGSYLANSPEAQITQEDSLDFTSCAHS